VNDLSDVAVTSFVPVDIYLVVKNPAPTNIGGVEFKISATGATVLTFTYPVNVVDISDANGNHAAGFGEPLPVTDDYVVVCTLNVLPTNATGSSVFHLGPNDLASVPGYPAYLDWDITSDNIFPLNPYSTDYALPALVLNGAPVDYCDVSNDPPLISDFTVEIAASSQSLMDSGNFIGTSEFATDGFDPGLDIPEPAPAPSGYLNAYFVHTNWPLGIRYSQDYMAQFDLERDVQTWAFNVETDIGGDIQLNFSPSFLPSEGVNLQLKDLDDNTTYNLFPALVYSFEAPSGPSVRHFEISVGQPGVPEFDPSSRYLHIGWSMIGAPLLPPDGANNIDDVIRDQAPTFPYIFSFGASNNYSLISGTEVVTPGNGYWIANLEGFEWTMPGLKNMDVTNIPLNQGWNIVGNPIWFSGPVTGVMVFFNNVTYTWTEAIASGLVSGAVMSYDNQSDTYIQSEFLNPWHGYWIRALAPNVELFFHWPNFLTFDKAAFDLAHKSSGLPKWSTDLVLTDQTGKEKRLTIGIDEQATADFDARLDLPYPPASPSGGTGFALYRPEWEETAGSLFMTDYSPASEEPVYWNAIISPMEEGKVTLSWTRTDWPEDLDYQLYLPEFNRVVVMSMKASDSVELDVGLSPLKVQVRTPDRMSSTPRETDGAYDLSVHPNPFNPTTTLSFHMVKEGSAAIRVYSVRGELVATIGESVYASGDHRVQWDGRTNSGGQAPSGSYFAKLFVDGEGLGVVKKMSLIR